MCGLRCLRHRLLGCIVGSPLPFLDLSGNVHERRLAIFWAPVFCLLPYSEGAPLHCCYCLPLGFVSRFVVSFCFLIWTPRLLFRHREVHYLQCLRLLRLGSLHGRTALLRRQHCARRPDTSVITLLVDNGLRVFVGNVDDLFEIRLL